jgi:hypothetical protein
MLIRWYAHANYYVLQNFPLFEITGKCVIKCSSFFVNCAGSTIAAGDWGNAGTNYVYVSVNGGYTWTQRQSTVVEGWAAIAMSASGATIVAGVGAGVGNNPLFYSTDTGATWLASGSPNQNWLDLAFGSTSQVVAAASTDGIFRSTNNGQTMTIVGTASPDFSYIASSTDGTKLVASASSNNVGVGVYYSSNSGTSFTRVNSANTGGLPSGKWARALGMSGDGSTIVAYIDDGTTKKSIDGGATWTACATPAGGTVYDIAVDTTGTKVFLTTGGSTAYTSTDSCATWTLSKTGGAFFWRVAASADFTTLVLVDNNPGFIYVSKNSGTTWNAAF